MTKILEDKVLNLTKINHLIYAAAAFIKEDVNGIGSYKSETQHPETPPWVRRIQESVSGTRKELSALTEM
jgi:hypothetical protein